MGEEEKKPEVEKKVVDEKPAPADEKKTEEAPAPPPPPPREIVLRVFMHCEGCARKVKKSLRGFNGVEDVITDCKNHTVVVKGEKADPLKVQERVQRKSHRQVELLSPLPKPPSEEEAPGKPADPEPKPEPPKEEKKDEPKMVTVVLKVHMHCEACAQEIKRRIERMKEVEEVTPDLKSSQVTVKGTFDPSKLVEYVLKRTGKHSEIVKQEPEEAKEEGDKPKEGKEEEKKKEEDSKAPAPEKKEDDEAKKEAAAAAKNEEEEVKVVEMKRNELYYYPPKYGMEMYHAYPPQIFSDENPNACSIM